MRGFFVEIHRHSRQAWHSTDNPGNKICCWSRQRSKSNTLTMPARGSEHSSRFCNFLWNLSCRQTTTVRNTLAVFHSICFRIDQHLLLYNYLEERNVTVEYLAPRCVDNAHFEGKYLAEWSILSLLRTFSLDFRRRQMICETNTVTIYAIFYHFWHYLFF